MFNKDKVLSILGDLKAKATSITDSSQQGVIEMENVRDSLFAVTRYMEKTGDFWGKKVSGISFCDSWAAMTGGAIYNQTSFDNGKESLLLVLDSITQEIDMLN